MLQLNKIKGADLKYSISTFKFQPKNTPDQVFLILHLNFFIFTPNFAIRQIQRN